MKVEFNDYWYTVSHTPLVTQVKPTVNMLKPVERVEPGIVVFKGCLHESMKAEMVSWFFSGDDKTLPFTDYNRMSGTLLRCTVVEMEGYDKPISAFTIKYCSLEPDIARVKSPPKPIFKSKP